MADSAHTNGTDSHPAYAPDDLAFHLWQRWETGPDPDVRMLLDEAGPLDSGELLAVLRVDQRQRWRRGKPLSAETYLLWWPEIESDPEQALTLVYGEYVLREELGQLPEAADYADRFPRYAARLQQQLSFHAALAADAGATSVPSGPVPGHAEPCEQTALRQHTFHAEPPNSTRRHDRYIPGSEIARGGMGVVYRATDTTLGREVAIKVLQEQFRPDSAAARRLADEAKIAAKLQHPAIPPVYDLGTLADGRPFLAMKLVDGATLDALLERQRGPDRGRMLAVFEQACQALAFAHAHHVIHRDLKPANLMVGNFGEVQVMDWGLAKLLGVPEASAETRDDSPAVDSSSPCEIGAPFTETGSVLGTPAFIPPEQANGAVEQVDKRSDVFGLGGLLCVILTGRPPFSHPGVESARRAAANGDLTEAFARLDACGADPELVALCKHCLAPRKEDRPEHAGEVARVVAELRAAADERARRADLERVRLEGERVAAAARTTERRKRQRLTLMAAVTLVIAVVVGLSAVLIVQRRANADLAAKNAALAEAQLKVDARFELARKAIARLHTGVSEDMLLQSERLKDLRIQLLREVADFYQDLERQLEGDSDPKSLRLLATGYFQLAELTEEIGSKRDALAVNRKALAVRRTLAALPGADLETRLDVARSLRAVGYLLYYLGDSEEALQFFQEQHDLAAELERMHPSPAVRSVLAGSLVASGMTLRQIGRSAEALAACAEGVAIQHQLAETNPADSELQYNLADCSVFLGNLLWDVGKWDRVLTVQNESRAILEKLAEANPSDTRLMYQLGTTYNNIGSTFFDQGRLAQALATHRMARTIASSLAASHPSVAQFQDLLAYNFSNAAGTLLELGKLTEAMTEFQKALAIRQKLAEANPADIQAQWNVAHSCNRIGEVYALSGKPEEARRLHERARILLTKAAEANRCFPSMWSELAFSYDKSGLLSSTTGNSAEALAACEQGLAIRQRQIEQQPGLVWLKDQLAECLAGLGTVQQRAGRTADAANSFRRAIALIEQMPTLWPRNLYNLARCQALLAGVACDRGSGVSAEEGSRSDVRALATLRQAFAAGFESVFRLRTDSSFEGLRPREDFQKLVREVESNSSKSPR